MGDAIVRFFDELGDALHGPRRARRRLQAEIAAHLAQAIAAERAAGLAAGEAEASALERLGTADQIAQTWNADRRASRKVRRRTTVAVTLAAAAAGALGITQYAAGKAPPPQPRRAPAVPRATAACGDRTYRRSVPDEPQRVGRRDTRGDCESPR